MRRRRGGGSWWAPQPDRLVERANRTVRVERWSPARGERTRAALNETRHRHLDCYGHRRPHRPLGMETPAEFARMIAVAT